MLEEFVKEAIDRIQPGDVEVVYVDEGSGIIVEDEGGVTIKVGVNDSRRSILKAIALAKAYNDPELVSIWAVTDELRQKPHSREGSLALLARVVDYVLVTAGYLSYVIEDFDKDYLRRLVTSVEPNVKVKAIKVLGLDVPFSIEKAGLKPDEGFEDVVKGINDPFIRNYIKLRTYLLNNTSLEYLLNYLNLIFR